LLASAPDRAGGGCGLFLYSLRHGGIPPKPPFRHASAQKQACKNSFPPTPFLFARLLETPSDFFGRRDLKLGGGRG